MFSYPDGHIQRTAGQQSMDTRCVVLALVLFGATVLRAQPVGLNYSDDSDERTAMKREAQCPCAPKPSDAAGVCSCESDETTEAADKSATTAGSSRRRRAGNPDINGENWSTTSTELNADPSERTTATPSKSPVDMRRRRDDSGDLDDSSDDDDDSDDDSDDRTMTKRHVESEADGEVPKRRRIMRRQAPSEAENAPDAITNDTETLYLIKTVRYQVGVLDVDDSSNRTAVFTQPEQVAERDDVTIYYIHNTTENPTSTDA